jgi:hypothetical protein
VADTQLVDHFDPKNLNTKDEQGSQVFLGTLYQSGKKLYQMTTKSPNAHEIYPMVVKYSK